MLQKVFGALLYPLENDPARSLLLIHLQIPMKFETSPKLLPLPTCLSLFLVSLASCHHFPSSNQARHQQVYLDLRSGFGGLSYQDCCAKAAALLVLATRGEEQKQLHFALHLHMVEALLR